jgi:hypothetical protein
MDRAERKDTAQHALVYVGVAVAVVIILVLLWYAIDVVLLAFIGVLLAILLRAPADWLTQRFGLRERWSLALVGVVILALLVAVAVLFGQGIVAQSLQLADRIPEIIETFRQKLGESELGTRVLTFTESSGLFALLRLESEDGVAGIAEGTIKNTRSGVSPRSLQAALEDVILPLVKGVDLADPKAVASAYSRIPENRLAKGLVDNACWTMRAAAARRPLYELLGGARTVEVCWTVTRDQPARMAKEAAEHCSRYGFRTLKVKGGQGIETDLAALAAIRDAVGSNVELYVDANAAYPRAQAPDYVRRIADAGATVAEDPSPLAPDAQFEDLQRASSIPILIDGSCTSARDDLREPLGHLLQLPVRSAQPLVLQG